jgi:hypothetical protein
MVAKELYNSIVLGWLALDGDHYVRWIVAQNPNTPIEALKLLASDGSRRVRINVAGNPKTPVETLRKLASDEEGDVRVAVASNPKSMSSVAVIFALFARVTINKENVETSLTKKG